MSIFLTHHARPIVCLTSPRLAQEKRSNVAKDGTMDRMGCKPGPLVSTKYVLPLNTFSTLLLNTHKNLTPIFCDNTPSPIQNYELIWRDVQLKPVLQGCLEIKVQRISLIIWF